MQLILTKLFLYLIILLNYFDTFAYENSESTGEYNGKIIDVTEWADQIGNKLWEIGKKVTKLDNIHKRYKEMNASVEETDGYEILKVIVSGMNRLIKEKVDAVLRIKNAAMKAESAKLTNLTKEIRDQFEYRNSKLSETEVEEGLFMVSHTLSEEGLSYTSMKLTREHHFYDVLVNINYSSVHVPTNIFERWAHVIEPIMWSENLDETFKSNYETDPSLMWQYYASSTGFLRHYPAFHWKMDPDKYDCRKRIWYIQAATCSKEVVILIDNSGTMYGMRNTIAQLTTDSLLQTFSNNDYINIYRLYNDSVVAMVECFNDTLIQATPENIYLFKQALYQMCPEKKINYLVGFTTAFTLLHDFLKNKTKDEERRNQAVFLLTDMLPSDSDFREIKNEYERIYNDTNIQVELFIYFIGEDIPEVKEVQWEKCLGKGSVVHVRTMDEVSEDALKYLSVIARTQNESTEYYPISWTHPFFDIAKDQGSSSPPDKDDENKVIEGMHKEYGNLSEAHLMTSVSAPVYSSNKSENSGIKKEEMIGVAAIDVPISDFERLAMPHKIGVNGYAFVVTNNGYLLFHPDLRPLMNGTLRENFNSVDLTEVEFFDDNENEPRKPHKAIYELRNSMVNQSKGSMEGLAIKFHYDDQMRIGSESRNYFFAPLKCSPFSLGLALPRGYGNYWVKTTEIINKTRSQNENYKDYFKGNWRIHPKWTYCDFRDKEKYNYNSPKEKLIKFLDMIFDDTSNFTWIEEHQIDDNDDLTLNDNYVSCFGNDTLEKPSQNYFCDKELMELLFFDAKLTQTEFDGNMTEEDLSFINDNKIRVRFVATQSGLTRWEDFSEVEDTEKNFGDKYDKTVDEIWYKSAVLLHQLKSQNFVFSLPKNEIYKNRTEKFITASHAIFYREGDNEAPGVVVGFQISYETIKKLIYEIPFCKNTTDDNLKYSHWDCYVIDVNGYVVYSEYDKNIGLFFGAVESAIMEEMIKRNIFRKISMFDYQAFEEEKKTNLTNTTTSASPASMLTNPFNQALWLMNWIMTKIVWLLVENNVWQFANAGSSCSSVTNINTVTSCKTCRNEISKSNSEKNESKPYKSCPLCCKEPKKYIDTCQTREELPQIERENKDKQKLVPVDKKFFLYLYTNLSAYGYNPEDSTPNENCSRPFNVKRIKNTNLILILVNSSVQTCFKTLEIEKEVIKYKEPYPDKPACNKKMINSYPRKKLRGCSNTKLQNRTREKCSSGSNFIPSNIFIFYNLFFFKFLFSVSAF